MVQRPRVDYCWGGKGMHRRGGMRLYLIALILFFVLFSLLIAWELFNLEEVQTAAMIKKDSINNTEIAELLLKATTPLKRPPLVRFDLHVG